MRQSGDRTKCITKQKMTVMKEYMKPGEYSRYARKTFRCVADNRHSQQKRCLLCELREYGLCDFVCCQPDERDDKTPVIFVIAGSCRRLITWRTKEVRQ